ncbi:Long-chain-fatty-acid--CoA ligase 6 [Lamellibrachia satsuma]|nr:Long-chain-fatty-acid--CoA ligase 6 [Lamellibrachia satsuma]
MVHGDSLKASLVAIVVPDLDDLCDWVKRKLAIEGASVAKLCARPDMKKAILEDMLAVGKKAGLKSFEQVRDIYLTADPFRVHNGLLTPTHKSKRHNIQRYYAKQIEEMYLHLQ